MYVEPDQEDWFYEHEEFEPVSAEDEKVKSCFQIDTEEWASLDESEKRRLRQTAKLMKYKI